MTPRILDRGSSWLFDFNPMGTSALEGALQSQSACPAAQALNMKQPFRSLCVHVVNHYFKSLFGSFFQSLSCCLIATHSFHYLHFSVNLLSCYMKYQGMFKTDILVFPASHEHRFRWKLRTKFVCVSIKHTQFLTTFFRSLFLFSVNINVFCYTPPIPVCL